MNTIIILIQKAIGQGVCMTFGANGEILTEKSGNLNLGVPGMMYMGGIAGLAGAYLYENAVANPVPIVGMLISFLCAMLFAALGGADLQRADHHPACQSERDRPGADHLCAPAAWASATSSAARCPRSARRRGPDFGQGDGQRLSRHQVPVLSELPVVGPIFFSYGFLTYFCVLIAIVMSWFLNRTRQGLNLRAVGETRQRPTRRALT